MSIFADLNSFQQIVIRNAIRKRLLFLFSTIVFFIIIYCYYKNHLREGAGVDILWRVTEAKYFLMGINPFDVLVGKTSIIPDFGAPAAYTYISYITVIPFAFLTDKTSILLIFSLIDFFCLYAGVFLNRKLIGAKYSIIDPIVLLITVISLITLKHLNYLNYGIIAVFGLVSVAYGKKNKSLIYIIVGIFLTSLKPSVLLPLSVALFFSKDFRSLGFIILINVLAISIVSLSVDTPVLTLAKQLQLTQHYFSDKGFYRWEGLFLFARDFIGRHTTIVGVVCTAVICFFYRKKISTDPVILIIIVIIVSLCFFYNQEHAWVMTYPLTAYCFYTININRRVVFPLVFLIIFMWMPSMYIYFESLGLYHYMALHNFFRFGFLIISGLWLVEIRLKSPGV